MVNRRHVVVIILSWIFMSIVGIYLAFEWKRLPAAQADYLASQVETGRIVYATNCANCHGPAGEGVIGPPLNRPAYRGEPAQMPDTVKLLTTTIADGRPGTADPRWVKLPNGAFASYTGMSAWSQSKGGPLTTQQIQALADFIMLGNWHTVAEVVPAPNLPTKADGSIDVQELYARLPAGTGLPAQTVLAAKELFRQKNCILCHTVGRAGGHVGPDLTKAGTWGMDATFIQTWVKNPPKVLHRAPEYWSNYGGPGQPQQPAVPLGMTQMPVLALTDAEAATLAAWLSSLQ